MIASEKSYQNLSDLNQLSLQNRFEVNKKQIFSDEDIFVFRNTRSSERIFNPMRYTGENLFHVPTATPGKSLKNNLDNLDNLKESQYSQLHDFAFMNNFTY